VKYNKIAVLNSNVSWHEGIAQVLEHLPSKHKVLSSYPNTEKKGHHKKMKSMQHTGIKYLKKYLFDKGLISRIYKLENSIFQKKERF
jgi:hypothetical protein